MDIPSQFISLFGAAVGGGLIVKLLDIAYIELRRRFDQSSSAKRFVDEHLDPLLKSADELVGKLHSLGREDFHSLRDLNELSDPVSSSDLGGLLYLFGRFWCRVEILKLQGLSVAISADKRGKKLQSFLNCLESRRVRLVDRTIQRAIAETLMCPPSVGIGVVRYIDFVTAASSDENTRRWVAPLRAMLIRGWHTSERQRLLLYASVVHAMIDTLDSRHAVTSLRPAIPKKMSNRTRSDLKFRVFGKYLAFVPNQKKYVGPSPKKSRLQTRSNWEAARKDFLALLSKAVRLLGRLYSGVVNKTTQTLI